jgi:hypothetical protein
VRVIQILAFFFLERFRVGDPESNNTPPLIQLVAFFPRAISQSTGNLGSFFFCWWAWMFGGRKFSSAGVRSAVVIAGCTISFN